jgi:hypothetical protein
MSGRLPVAVVSSANSFKDSTSWVMAFMERVRLRLAYASELGCVRGGCRVVSLEKFRPPTKFVMLSILFAIGIVSRMEGNGWSGLLIGLKDRSGVHACKWRGVFLSHMDLVSSLSLIS